MNVLTILIDVVVAMTMLLVLTVNHKRFIQLMFSDETASFQVFESMVDRDDAKVSSLVALMTAPSDSVNRLSSYHASMLTNMASRIRFLSVRVKELKSKISTSRTHY